MAGAAASIVCLLAAFSCVPEPSADVEFPVPVEVARIQVDNRLPVTMVVDLDGDGLDELIVADVLAGAYPRTESGLVRVLSAPLTSGDWNELPTRLALRGEEPFRHFGTAMTAGDLDGDGVRDLVLRADPSPDGVGTICAVSGALSGEQTIESAAFLAVSGPSTLGQAMRSVDYNADGVDDLVVSCPVRSEVYVVLGPRAGQIELPHDADAVFYTQSGSLGWTAAGGDFNADGLVDLALCEPISGAIFLVPGGLTGRHEAGATAWAVVHSSASTDDLLGVDALPSLGSGGPALLVRSRRTDSEQAGTVFVVDPPIAQAVDVRSDSSMTLEYVAAVLGASTTRISGPSNEPLLAIGTAGRLQIPDSNLKGGLFVLGPDPRGEIHLDPGDPASLGWYLRPQDVGFDWLGRDVLTGRLIEASSQNLVVSAKGAVLIFGW